MQNRFARLAGIGRLATIAMLATAIATPASAQFGGLKKRLKGTAAQEGATKAATAAGAPEAPAAEGAAGGGTIVLTEDVVAQLITGLKAGQAERDAAAREDTPYGRYRKAEAAYAVAEPKCQAAQQTFPQRMANDQKTMDKYSALVDKMVDAQTKGDQKRAKVYQDSAMAMQDPSCVVERPTQPDGYWEAQREVDSRSEKQEMKASGFSRSELAMVKERTEAILRGGTPPGDASPGEKSAVSSKSSELKPLLGIHDQPPVREAKAAPAAAPAPVAPAGPGMTPAQSKMTDCMVKNTQKHQAEIEALGKRAEAAQAANDMDKIMAIADTLQQLQTAGCR